MQRQGLSGWYRSQLRGKKGQQGFTLIELLVVVTILGILAAIVTLSLVGLTTNASVQSCNSEYKTVQAALDAYMANNNLAVLPSAQTAYTNDMQATGTGTVALYNSAPSASSPNYTRNGTTQFFYKWDQFGRISSIATNAGGTQLSGCAPK